MPRLNRNEVLDRLLDDPGLGAVARLGDIGQLSVELG